MGKFREYLNEAKTVDVLVSGTGSITTMKIVKGELGKKIVPVTNFKRKPKIQLFKGTIDGKVYLFGKDKISDIYVAPTYGGTNKGDEALFDELLDDGTSIVHSFQNAIEDLETYLKEH